MTDSHTTLDSLLTLAHDMKVAAMLVGSLKSQLSESEYRLRQLNDQLLQELQALTRQDPSGGQEEA